MKRIMLLSIPAYGHTNPMLPVAKELVNRGNAARFYSFNEFKKKIQATGAEFIPCDSFLPELGKREMGKLQRASSSEMMVQDLRIAMNMDAFLTKEVDGFKPDVIFTDSVCFWGKLTALKHSIPMVVSTSTFAFNRRSSKYLKSTVREKMDLALGLPKIYRELRKLEGYGYEVKNVLSLIQSDDDTDSVVYTSRAFQPYGESFPSHYAFVGPSLLEKDPPSKEKERPLIYISLGTVINDRPDFYNKCIKALEGLELDVVLSYGFSMDKEALGDIPSNFSVKPHVNQLEILSKADLFITHCGMNSVSESLYMATPMILYPQTSEQRAVARRVHELGAGEFLKDDSVKGIQARVRRVLESEGCSESAQKLSLEFRACPGPKGAADFIEAAPHG